MKTSLFVKECLLCEFQWFSTLSSGTQCLSCCLSMLDGFLLQSCINLSLFLATFVMLFVERFMSFGVFADHLAKFGDQVSPGRAQLLARERTSDLTDVSAPELLVSSAGFVYCKDTLLAKPTI